MKKNSDLLAENEALRRQIAALETKLAQQINACKTDKTFLAENQERYQALFETMAQGVVYQDGQGNIFLANPAAEQILGLSLDETQGRTSTDPRWHAIHEDGSAFPGDQHPAMQALRSGKPVHNVVMGVFHPSKSAYLWILVNAVPNFRVGESKPYQVYATFTDITERRQAEEKLRDSEEFVRLAYEAANLGIWKNDLSTGTVYFDERARAHYGFDRLETTLAEVMNRIHPEDVANLETEIAAATAPNGSGKFSTEYRVIHPDGNLRWLAIGVRVIFEGSGAQRHALMGYGTSIDITERKQTELIQKKNEHILRLFVEHSPASIAMFDSEMRYIIASRRYLVDYGLGEQNLTGRSHYDILPEIPERWKEIHRRCLAGAIEKAAADPFPRADGRLDWVRWEIRPWYESEGQVGGLILFSELITERKQVEDALHESEASLKQSQAVAHVGHWNWDTQTNKVTWSEEMKRIFGLDPQTFDGDLNAVIARVIHPDDQNSIREANEAVINEQATTPLEYRVIWPDGSIRHIWAQPGEKLTDENGTILRLSGIVQDITARKQAEIALRESEEKYRTLIYATDDGVYIAQDEKFIFTNPALPARLGYTLEEFENLPFSQVLASEYLEIWTNRFRQRLVGKNPPSNYQVEFLHKFGQKVWFDIRATLISYHERPAVFGIARDITEQRQVQEQLRQSEERYRYLFENNPHPMWAYDLQTMKFLAVNEAAINKYGYTRAEFLSMTLVDIRPPEEVDRLLENLAQPRPAMQHSGEWRHKLKQGKVIDVEITSHTIDIEGINAVLVVAQDITERKQTERLTYAQRDLARSIGSFDSLDSGLKSCFEAALKISGLTCGGVYLFNSERTVLELAHHQGLSPAFLWEVASYPIESPIVQSILPGNSYHMMEDKFSHVELYRLEGLKTICIAPISYQGQVIGCLNLAAHIPVQLSGFVHGAIETLATEIGNYVVYLRAELALRQSEENLKRAQAVANVGSWVAHLQTKTTEWSDETCRIFGAPDGKQVTFEMFFSAIHPEDRQMVDSAWQAALQGEGYDVEHRIVRADGEIRWVHQISDITFSPEDQPLIVMGTVQDITARKQAEFESFYRQSRLEQVIQLGKSITAITDLDQCLRAIYSSVSQGLGFDWVGLFVYDADRETVHGAYCTSRLGQMESNNWYEESIRDNSDWQIALQSPAGIAFTEDYQASHNPLPENEMYGVKEHVTLAAWAGDKPVALLTVDNLISAQPITHADLEALQLFAGYAGLAIENARMNTLLEQRVKDRTAEVQDLYDNAPTGYHSLDAEGRFVVINQTELDWLGYTREEIIGRRFAEVITTESLEIFKTNFPLFMQRGWVRDLEFEMIRKDGSTFPVLLSATAITDQAGNYLMSRSTMFDNTQRKLAHAAMRESEKTYRALFETANDAIFLIDVPTRTYARVNPRCAELLGVQAAEVLLGRHAHEFIKPVDVASEDDHFQLLLSGQFQPTYERTFIRVDGSLVETEINLSLIRDGQGNPRFIQSVVRDISERKKVEQVLRRANLELERSMRMKDEFLASMSHELRTPLTGILGLSEALQLKTYGDLSERQTNALKHIENSGRHLLDLINDILDLSKIEAGKFEMQFAPCSLREVCQASLQLTKSMANKKQQKVSFKIEPDNLIINTDARRLKQMLVNLLSNAIKFTAEGGSLGLEVKASEKDGVVNLTVWDNGIGITPEDLNRLFKPFVQLDSSLARQHAGTGLGLSLVQRMAELQGGSVRVESAPGEGSRLTILLPWNPYPAQPIQLPNRGTGALNPSLVVDDSEIDAENIARYLRLLGIENMVHSVGRGAVEAAVRMKPGAILLDLHLPDIPGFEVLAALKSDPQTHSIPVVICSVEESRQQAIAAGAAGYLVKPFTLDEMRIELERVAAEHNLHESVLTIAPHHASPRIMVVDDNEVNLETISDFLGAQNFEVVLTRSGMETLEQVPTSNPDLILMDIQMPGMDGLETIRRIRAHTDPQVARIPIIALTALAMPGDREMCLAAGANEYLAKPVQLKKLEETIRKILSHPPGQT